MYLLIRYLKFPPLVSLVAGLTLMLNPDPTGGWLKVATVRS